MLWEYLGYKTNITIISTSEYKVQLMLCQNLCHKTNITVIHK